MRLLYSLAWCIALPFTLIRLWLRGKKEPGYRRHIGERLGIFPAIKSHPRIWVHAVSAGETRAAEPLIRALLYTYPNHHILLTHMTPIGRETGKNLFANEPIRVSQAFIPYDINWMIRRFLRHFAPSICVLIETEVWPNLIAETSKANIPVTLVNARLSEKSLKKAQKLSWIMNEAAQTIDFVAAQSKPDADRLTSLGVKNLCVTGNMKFDVTPPPHMAERGLQLRRFFGDRPVFICASTREGEEPILIEAFLRLKIPKALLILTPRHPQRFDLVADLLKQHQISFERRTALNIEHNYIEHNDVQQTPTEIDSNTQILLGDTMGEMYMYYAASDVAFVGGSLVALGGHNLIEAFAMSKPVLVGPHTFNFSEITEQAIQANCAIRAQNADEILVLAQQLIDDNTRRKDMGNKAHAFFLQHQGATQKTLDAISKLIKTE